MPPKKSTKRKQERFDQGGGQPGMAASAPLQSPGSACGSASSRPGSRNANSGPSSQPGLLGSAPRLPLSGQRCDPKKTASANGELGSTKLSNAAATKCYQSNNRKAKFEPYWSLPEVSAGLKRGTLIQGAVRINPKNFEDAYVPHPDGVSDIYIPSREFQNRALNGDIVAVELFSPMEWKVFSDSLDSHFSKMTLAEGPTAGVALGAAPSTDRDGVAADTCLAAEAAAVVCPTAEDAEDSGPTCDADDDTCPAAEDTCPAAEAPAGAGQAVKAATSASSNGQRPPDQAQTKVPEQKAKKSKTNTSTRRSYKSLSDYTADSRKEVLLRRFFPDVANDKLIPRQYLQPTGKIVAIIEKKHSRACAGFLKPRSDGKTNSVLFSPTDSRLPRINIPVTECPEGFLERPGDFASTLYVCRITSWPESSVFAEGMLSRSLGEAGEIEPETEGILLEYGVDCSDFSPECLACLPRESPWSIPPKELDVRRDFREKCVFTIDPATARDLDDAVSCEKLPDGFFEVGVHIADVSYFLAEGTPLDYAASQRATSVYLVQKVIPMLPRLLCEQLCSLNPGVDRLTFSVVWQLDADGKVYDEWFGRTIIRSCAKLSYDHAQGFIEDPAKSWTTNELPQIFGGFIPADLVERVLTLDMMAKKMRQRRADNGALRLDQVKLSFSLDASTGLPNGYFVYQQRDANKLIEEFMLLANMAVARKIYKDLPGKALLRRHPPPQGKIMMDVADQCSAMGLPIDISSAGALQKSLSQYSGSDDEEARGYLQILVSMCAKPMQMARYFCTGVLPDEAEYRHYALAVPLYTHFTSPIRRYADVIVHRQLAATLKYTAEPTVTAVDIERQAVHCNDKKTNSKRVQELSIDMYFATFIKSCGPVEEKAMVMAVLDRSFDVFVLKLGVIGRVYCEKLPLEDFKFSADAEVPELLLTWKSPKENEGCGPVQPFCSDLSTAKLQQRIEVLVMVDCILQPDEKPLKWMVTIKPPN